MKRNALTGIHAGVLIAVLSLSGCGGGGADGDSGSALANIDPTNKTTNIATDTNPTPTSTSTSSTPTPTPIPTPTNQDVCVYGKGYWQSKPNVIWPSQYSRNLLFFRSGQYWQQVLDTPDSTAPGYYQLAYQYITTTLNIAANPAYSLHPENVPQDVQDVLFHATAWFVNNDPSECAASGSCDDQKNWASVLASYNNGTFSGGPVSCSIQ